YHLVLSNLFQSEWTVSLDDGFCTDFQSLTTSIFMRAFIDLVIICFPAIILVGWQKCHSKKRLRHNEMNSI
ncbi:hypothetical protein ACEE22_11010, partial [Streptococcus suis]